VTTAAVRLTSFTVFVSAAVIFLFRTEDSRSPTCLSYWRGLATGRSLSATYCRAFAKIEWNELWCFKKGLVDIFADQRRLDDRLAIMH
jgi:hypothetical protein